MLENAKLVGFLFTKDYDAARAFYVGKLGFTFVSLDQFALVVKAGEQMIRIVKIPNFTPHHATVLGWEVPDIEATAKWLTERGVPTEKFPWVQNKETGIWDAPGGDRVAWFKDADGNTLGISHHAS